MIGYSQISHNYMHIYTRPPSAYTSFHVNAKSIVLSCRHFEGLRGMGQRGKIAHLSPFELAGKRSLRLACGTFADTSGMAQLQLNFGKKPFQGFRLELFTSFPHSSLEGSEQSNYYINFNYYINR